jgi:hypothetical protein
MITGQKLNWPTREHSVTEFIIFKKYAKEREEIRIMGFKLDFKN